MPTWLTFCCAPVPAQQSYQRTVTVAIGPFTSVLRHSVSSTLTELSQALSDGELVPYFQPIVELRSGRLSGFEVLARWQHPIHGALLPENLIELAEANGLIAEVSRQIFTKAFSQVAAVAEPLRLSVNLSPVQLGYYDLVQQIEGMASSSGFPLNRLTIEITESAPPSDLTRSHEIARELKRARLPVIPG